MENQAKSTFVGVEVTSEKIVWVEAEGEDAAVLLSNACLVKEPKNRSARVCLEIRSPDPETKAASTCAVLSASGMETQKLSIMTTRKIGLILSGAGAKGAVVHVVGYSMQAEPDVSFSDSDSDDMELDAMELDLPDAMRAMLSAADGGDASSEDDDDDRSDGDTAADNMAALQRMKGNGETSSAVNEKAIVPKRSQTSSQFKTHKSGLKFQDLLVGAGKEVKKGRNIAVEYVLRLESGKVVDKTRKKQPFKFRLGIGECIKGFDIGIAGMREGGSRHLVVPSDIGYGKQGAPPDIPPNATLFFDIKVVKAW